MAEYEHLLSPAGIAQLRASIAAEPSSIRDEPGLAKFIGAQIHTQIHDGEQHSVKIDLRSVEWFAKPATIVAWLRREPRCLDASIAEAILPWGDRARCIIINIDPTDH